MHTPLGYTIPLAAGIKEVVRLPVFATGRINDPTMAERILADGQADMIGMVRAQICDPEMANKAREGRLEDIRYCVADNQACYGRVGINKTLGCMQNPAVGREKEQGIGTIKPALIKKEVLIVGGGPAGLRAAEVAAETRPPGDPLREEGGAGRPDKYCQTGRRAGRVRRYHPQ